MLGYTECIKYNSDPLQAYNLTYVRSSHKKLGSHPKISWNQPNGLTVYQQSSWDQDESCLTMTLLFMSILFLNTYACGPSKFFAYQEHFLKSSLFAVFFTKKTWRHLLLHTFTRWICLARFRFSLLYRRSKKLFFVRFCLIIN